MTRFSSCRNFQRHAVRLLRFSNLLAERSRFLMSGKVWASVVTVDTSANSLPASETLTMASLFAADVSKILSQVAMSAGNNFETDFRSSKIPVCARLASCPSADKFNNLRLTSYREPRKARSLSCSCCASAEMPCFSPPLPFPPSSDVSLGPMVRVVPANENPSSFSIAAISSKEAEIMTKSPSKRDYLMLARYKNLGMQRKSTGRYQRGVDPRLVAGMLGLRTSGEIRRRSEKLVIQQV